MLLPLGGCEMVLGIQWSATLGDIQWNFKQLTMEFKCEGTVRMLKGISQVLVKWMTEKQCLKEVCQPRGELSAMTLCVFPMSFFQAEQVQEGSNKKTYDKEVDRVLTKFKSVFDMPSELPPHRSHDHSIPLVTGVPPVNIRPYRHPPS